MTLKDFVRAAGDARPASSARRLPQKKIAPHAEPRVLESWPRVQLAGIATDLLEDEDAIQMIIDHARRGIGTLGVVSANLDHLHHFGSGRTSAKLQRREVIDLSLDGDVRWLTLLDGAPLVRRASELTGRPWSRLAGSDLMEPLMDEAERTGLSVGFLGGSPETLVELGPVMGRRWPRLRLAGSWSPSRAQLSDPDELADLAADIRASGVDILAVCLGKPRQEKWIAEWSSATGAKVCLAFGAVVDFLAGRVDRAPRWASDHGLEWAWRLSKEPKRLARRYLVQGPPAWRALQGDSYVSLPTTYFPEPAVTLHPTLRVSATHARFVGPESHAGVAVVVVTYNNAQDVEQLIGSLRTEAESLALRLVVVDNDSTDGTLSAVGRHDDVIAIDAGSNLGYAGGINLAMRHTGDAESVLVLNPDLELAPNALRVLRARLQHERVGVAVPRMLDANGEVYASLRREPTLGRALGDALFGERLSGRPGALSEIELNRRNYRHPHQVDWATGAALLIDADVARAVGDWDDEFFLYSEEVDYLRRVRELGHEVWFEPEATVQHRRGGSGASDELEALMAVNRVRYAEKWHGYAWPVAFRGAVLLASVLRARQGRHRAALRYLVSRSRWDRLPSVSANVSPSPPRARAGG